VLKGVRSQNPGARRRVGAVAIVLETDFFHCLGGTYDFRLSRNPMRVPANLCRRHAFEDEDDDEYEDDCRADASPGSWILAPDS
jgi:hypothetical protein